MIFLFVGFNVKLCQLVQIRTSVVALIMQHSLIFRFRLVQICTSVVGWLDCQASEHSFRLVQIRTSVVADDECKTWLIVLD